MNKIKGKKDLHYDFYTTSFDSANHIRFSINWLSYCYKLQSKYYLEQNHFWVNNITQSLLAKKSSIIW